MRVLSCVAAAALALLSAVGFSQSASAAVTYQFVDLADAGPIIDATLTISDAAYARGFLSFDFFTADGSQTFYRGTADDLADLVSLTVSSRGNPVLSVPTGAWQTNFQIEIDSSGFLEGAFDVGINAGQPSAIFHTTGGRDWFASFKTSVSDTCVDRCTEGYWKQVPEPPSAPLLLLGIGVAYIRRRLL